MAETFRAGGGGLPLEDFFEHTPLEDENDVSATDPRRDDTSKQLHTALRAQSTPKDRFGYEGVVVNVYPSNTAAYVKRGQALNMKATTRNLMNPRSSLKIPVDTESAINVYKIWMKGDPRPFPCGPNDPVLYTYPEILAHESLRDKEPFSVGTIVELDDKKQSTIVNFYPGAVPIQWRDKNKKAALWKNPAATRPPRIVNSVPGTPHPSGGPPATPKGKYGEFTGPTPNADRLRAVLEEFNGKIYEKVKTGHIGELSNGGDLDPRFVAAAISIYRKIHQDYPNIKIILTGGNDTAHGKSTNCATHRHRCGLAIDMAVIGTPSELAAGTPSANLDNVLGILKRYAAGNGGRFRYQDEYRYPSRAASGGHVHMSWGEPGDREFGSVMRAAVAAAEAGEITPLQVTG